MVLAACGSPDAGLGSASTPEPTALAETSPTPTEVPPFEPYSGGEVMKDYHAPPEPTVPTPDPDGAFGFYMEISFVSFEEMSLEDWVAPYDLIVAGTVVDILPAHWTTPDFQRPSNPWETNIEETTIITPVVIQVDLPVLVNEADIDLSAGQLVLAAYGGSVGEDEVVTNSSDQRFEPGERVLLGLTDRPHHSWENRRFFPTPLGPAWNVGIKWTLNDDGTALLAFWDAVPQPTEELIADILAIKDTQ